MSRDHYFEFDATAGADGQFSCDRVTEVHHTEERKQQSHQSHQSHSQSHDHFHQSFNGGDGPYNPFTDGRPFGNSEGFGQQHFNAGVQSEKMVAEHAERVDKMREQFEQMRQDMLDRMAEFTGRADKG